MNNLVLAALFFVVMHRGVSGSPLRQVLVRRVGENAYGGLFTLVSLAAVAWLAFAYAGAASAIAAAPLWDVHPAFYYLQWLLQPLAMLFIGVGVATPNPGMARQAALVHRGEIVRGMLRVTRHPFLWGVALLSAGHLMVVPTPRAFVLFGTLLFVALSGTTSIDRKRLARLGEKWSAFQAQTSNVPFGAILSGRQHFPWGEIGWRRLLLSLALAGLVVWLHSWRGASS